MKNGGSKKNQRKRDDGTSEYNVMTLEVVFRVGFVHHFKDVFLPAVKKMRAAAPLLAPVLVRACTDRNFAERCESRSTS